MENNTKVQCNLQTKCHYFVLSLVNFFDTYFLITVIRCGYVRRKQDSSNWVCPHRTYRAITAAVPSFLSCSGSSTLSLWNAASDWFPSSHAYVLLSWWFSLCRCMHFNLCNTQDVGRFLRQDAMKSLPECIPQIYFFGSMQLQNVSFW